MLLLVRPEHTLHPLLCVTGRRVYVFGPAPLQAPRAPFVPGFLNVWANIQIVYGLFMEIKPCCSFNRIINTSRLTGEDAVRGPTHGVPFVWVLWVFL